VTTFLRTTATNVDTEAAPASSHTTRPNEALPKLDLTFRIGVAGNRQLPEAAIVSLDQRLQAIHDVVSQALARLASPTARASTEPKFTTFYSDTAPLIRLVSGLADGADQLAAERLLAQPSSLVGHEIAAVLPFDTVTYRDCSSVQDKRRFDLLLRQCRYVMELDGRYDKPDPDTELAQHRRACAYRAQAAILLRQIDLLIAMADSTSVGHAGGTRETIESALALGIPVVFLPVGAAGVVLLKSPAEAEISLHQSSPAWEHELGQLVSTIVANPQAHGHRAVSQGQQADASARTKYEQAFLQEFFSNIPQPSTFRGWLWSACERHFRNTCLPLPGSDQSLDPFTAFRRRAAVLNSYYAGLYRGAFLLNYLLAVAAVTLAVLSLILLFGADRAAKHAGAHSPTTAHRPSLAPTVSGSNLTTQITATDSEHVEAQPALDPPEPSEAPAVGEQDRHYLLLILGLAKLAAVFAILQNTHAANHEGWNEKAIDYRFLAERLRAMFYLPRLGSFRPPTPAWWPYTSGVLRQSVVEWLFWAIVRHTDPAVSLGRSPAQEPLRPVIPDAVQKIQDHWIENQIRYHERNADTMKRMGESLEYFAVLLNASVLFIVILDIVALIITLCPALPETIAAMIHTASPWLLFLAAVLPAAVASLNGIRFQAECRRLEDRSTVMTSFLKATKTSAEALGATLESSA